MEIDIGQLTDFDGVLLGRAYEATAAQFEMARRIVRDHLMVSNDAVTDGMLIEIAQVIATNYVAAVQRAAG